MNAKLDLGEFASQNFISKESETLLEALKVTSAMLLSLGNFPSTTILNPFSRLAVQTVACVLMALMTLHVHARMIFEVCFVSASNRPQGISIVTTQPQNKSR